MGSCQGGHIDIPSDNEIDTQQHPSHRQVGEEIQPELRRREPVLLPLRRIGDAVKGQRDDCRRGDHYAKGLEPLGCQGSVVIDSSMSRQTGSAKEAKLTEARPLEPRVKPDGLQLGDSLCARFALRAPQRPSPLGLPDTPASKTGLTTRQMRSACYLRGFGTVPLRRCGNTLTPSLTRDYASPLRSPWHAAEVKMTECPNASRKGI